MKKILLLKIITVGLLLATFVAAQMPSSTPEPKVSEEVLQKRKSDDAELEAKRFAKMPIRMSKRLANTAGGDQTALIWLVADYRGNAENPRIELKMQIGEKCFAEPSEAEKNLRETANLNLSGTQISGEISVAYNFQKVGENEIENCRKNQSLTKQLSDDEEILLRNTESLTITWSYGKVEITPEGLATMREFLDKEIPSLPKQAKVAENSPSFYDWLAGIFAFFQPTKA